jgi:hypothetical protein
MNIDIREFTVLGLPYGNLFAHHWYIGTEDQVDLTKMKIKIDEKLCFLNDDYAVERKHALKDVNVTVISPILFYAWMKSEGKEGGQYKFPRVLKGEKQTSWLNFLQNQSPKG